MKRSEVLERMERRMSELFYAEDINETQFEDEYKAEALLKVIEDTGMIREWEPELDKEVEV